MSHGQELGLLRAKAIKDLTSEDTSQTGIIHGRWWNPVIERKANERILFATIGVGSEPIGVAFVPNKKDVFVVNSGSNTVSLIFGSSGVVTLPFSHLSFLFFFR
jgi:hypothetical protein